MKRESTDDPWTTFGGSDPAAMAERDYLAELASRVPKGKRHWTKDRRVARRQGRDQKYWSVPE